MVGRKLTRRRQRGLTLVELLVVVAILAIASSVVLLTAPPLRPKVRDDAERFAARLEAALDQSVVSSRPVRLSIDPKGYSFQAFGDDGWATDEFAPAPRLFDKRTTATPKIAEAANSNARALGDEDVAGGEENEDESENGKENGDAIFIPLDALGGQLPFSVNFSSADGSWTVELDDKGGVSVRRNG